MTAYGLTPQGFVPKQQATIITEIQSALQSAFGTSINLLPRSVFSQVLGIFSEREALLWQLAEAVYASQYPAGAEGTSVDNILALNNLRRLAARETVTAPTSTTGIPGLVLYGTPTTLIPAGSTLLVTGNTSLQFTTDADATIASPINAVQQLSLFGGIPTQGAFSLQIVDADGNTLTSFPLYFDALGSNSKLIWRNSLNVLTPPSSGNFILTLTRAGVTSSTVSLPYSVSAGALQTAIQTLSAYSTATVTAITGGFQIVWGGLPEPKLGISSSTLVFPSSGAAVFVDSVQAAVNALYDASTAVYPYTDATCSGSMGSGLVLINFGAGTVATGQPVSSAQAQNLFTVSTSTLQDGTVVINVNIANGTTGAPAQVVTSATCTVTGPNFVPANYLNIIGSPISGWTSVNNPLDCITGADQETDTAALARRATLLAAQANGPIQAIAERVALVSNVEQAVGFENTSLAADQVISFTGAATGGYFVLRLAGIGGFTHDTAQIPWDSLATTQRIRFSATPSAGGFKINIGVQQTSLIPYNATASAVQLAVRALTGYSAVTVTGSVSTAGLNLAFGLSLQTPISVTDFGLDATMTVKNSVQSFINEIAEYLPTRVTGSFGAGFTLMFNGSSGGAPQLLASIPDNSLVGVSAVTVAFGKPGKSFEIVVSDNNGQASDTAIADAIFASKPAGIASYGNTGPLIETDAAGNSYPIYFTRPTQVPIYILLTLETDLTTSPSPKFNPGSIPTIQQDLVTVGEAFPIGGTIIGFGSDGLIGAINSVPGIVHYTMAFGTSPTPTSNENISLQSTQVALFESFNIVVSYS